MATATKPKTGHYTLAEVLDLLACDRSTFYRSYLNCFTDARPQHKRGTTSRRKFLRIEVDLAVSDGFDALADFRSRMGRE